MPPNRRLLTTFGASLCLLLSCGDGAQKRQTSIDGTKAVSQDGEPVYPEVSELQKSLKKQKPLRPGAPSDAQKKLAASVDTYFQAHSSRRYYLHLDKPLYKPGETIWFRLWELGSSTLTTNSQQHGATIDLISPKGASVLTKRIKMGADAGPGMAANDFALPDSVQGGEYTLRIRSDQGATSERKLIISQYQAPRIKKKAEFLRKAYGPGDKVTAAVSVHRGTGEALANKSMVAIVQVDSAEVARFNVSSDAEGNALVSFTLPKSIRVGDGLLTLLVEDGGVTESLQKRVPIVLKNISFEMFPEGGDLVAGLPGRVYFSAKNSLGKAADVEGHIEDSNGNKVADFRSFHNGLGRYELTPSPGKVYFAVIDKPLGIKARFDVPAAKAAGCTLQSIDDYTGASDELGVGVWCTESQSLIASAVLREKTLGDASFAITAGKANVLAFPVPVGSQGAVRVTLFDDALSPMAERLIYRGRGQDLKLSITSDQPSYAPRDQVKLTVHAEDLAGKPVEANLSLAVVDDTVLSFADDKTAHLLTRLYLESEMPGQKIEEPNFYFSDKSRAAAGLDLVLGTQGWRRFAWQKVLNPVVVQSNRKSRPFGGDFAPPPPMAAPMEAAPAPMKKPGGAAKMPQPVKAAENMAAPLGRVMAEAPMPDMEAGMGMEDMDDEIGAWDGNRAMAGKKKMMDKDWAGAERRPVATWAVYREFPAPNYEAAYDGPRHDFRETIHWVPNVNTNAEGDAKVDFYLSDSVTSFRVHAEGVSQGGLPGRVEQLVQSKLPVSLAVKMPLEVSKGDLVRLPISLANETKRSYEVKLTGQFGSAFKLVKPIPTTLKLKGGERRSFFAELEVIGDGANLSDGLMRVAIDTSNLRDEVEHEVRVVPLGFPQELSLAGTASGTAKHEFTLTGVIPGSIQATLTMYPSPLATMTSGTEAIIREPYGCFEQASSANYPNIMVLAYLEENKAAKPALIAKTMGHLDKGYKMLTGYESPKKGFEWFGGDPGHEALTAYGLMEFVDMAKVYGDVDAGMIKRTSAWLKSRRDGKGGFKRNSRALDSFGKASEDVTNSYISYALSQTGDNDLAPELARQKKTAAESKDPYVLALAANMLVNVEPTASTTIAALKKLAALQSSSGAFSGADHSITRSGGIALELEATSLATLALLKGGKDYVGNVRESIGWINKNRSGAGGFGSTQSTVLSLAALSAYAESTRATQSGGVATVMINGKASGTLRFEKGHTDALVFDDIASALKPGKNTIELRLESENALPYSIGIEYRSKHPASSKETAVRIFAKLKKTTVPVGEGVRMDVTVTNLTDKGQPMTLARVGLPGGLTFQTWQLKELMDKKIIDFYETREREVVLYFRSLAPNAVMKVPLELIARVPGTYVGPASQAYLYYTDEFRHWAEPLRVTIK